MAKLSYPLIYLLFEKLKAEDKKSKKRVFDSNNNINTKIAEDRVFDKASDFLLEKLGNSLKTQITRKSFTDDNKKNIWCELFGKNKNLIEKSKFKTYLATESWIQTLYGHYDDYVKYNGHTIRRVHYAIAFYFRCYNLEELEKDIEQNCTELKERFKEDIYKGLFDDLPEIPEKEIEKKVEKKDKRKWFNFNTVTLKFFLLITIPILLIPASLIVVNYSQKNDTFNDSEQIVTYEEHFERAKISKENWYYCEYAYWENSYPKFGRMIEKRLVAEKIKVKMLIPNNEKDIKIAESYLNRLKSKNYEIDKYVQILYSSDIHAETYTIYDPITEKEETYLIEPGSAIIGDAEKKHSSLYDKKCDEKKSQIKVREFINVWNKAVKKQRRPKEWLILQNRNDL